MRKEHLRLENQVRYSGFRCFYMFFYALSLKNETIKTSLGKAAPLLLLADGAVDPYFCECGLNCTCGHPNL